MAVVDNNVLSSLAKVDRLTALEVVFDEVTTTPSVLDELHHDTVSGYAFVERINEIKQYNGGWLRIISPTVAEIQLTEEILDPSLSYTDAELIAVAECREIPLLTDDTHVGGVATARDVNVWDLTLFVRAACETEVLETANELQAFLADLGQKDYYEFSDEDEEYLLDYFLTR